MKKWMWLLVVAVLLVLGVFFYLGCSTSPTGGGSSTGVGSLNHWGFDFATGTNTDEVNKTDGATCNWNPDYVVTTVEGTTYPSYSTYIWWSGGYAYLDVDASIKHMGEVELSSITSAPSSWDSGSGLCPLLVDHIYVVKCSPEGYAAFKVTSFEATGNWTAEVEYVYTSGTTF